MDLRPYQQRCIADARALYRDGKRAICIVAPCGAGKTIIGSAIASSAVARGSVLWLAHRHELIEQARAKLPPAVRVATIQGLLASGERPPGDVVVYDECHHLMAGVWRHLTDHYHASLRIGLTATPERADGQPLGDIFDGLVVAASYSELLAGGWIVPCDVIAPGARGTTLAAPAAEATREHAAGQRAIVYCSTVAEAQDVARALWPDAVAVDGETPDEMRADAVDAFRAGRFRVLTNVYVFSEGFDAPETSVCVLARGAGHASTYLQMCGRALRPAPGKSRALLVDLCGCVHEHGWPTEDRDYSLDGTPIRRRGEKKPVVWQCRGCGRCYQAAPADRRCPACGVRLPEPKQIAVARRRLARQERAAHASPEERAAALARFRSIAAERGYKPGWAAVQFKARFGHWPRA